MIAMNIIINFVIILAVPTLKLKLMESDGEISSRSIRSEQKLKKDIVDTLLKNTDDCFSSCMTTEEVDNKSNEDVVLKEVYQELFNKYKYMEKQNEELQCQIKLQQAKIDNLERQLTKVNDCLDSMFSKTQLEIVLKNKKRVIWHTSDISKAFALRYLSRRCYNYVRNTLKFPLPHQSTLQKWAAKLNFKGKGLLEDVINFMNIAGMKMTDFDCITVLQFDEMKVNSIYEYDKVLLHIFYFNKYFSS